MLYIYGDINKLEREEKKERTENNLQGTEKKKRRRKTYLPHTNMNCRFIWVRLKEPINLTPKGVRWWEVVKLIVSGERIWD